MSKHEKAGAASSTTDLSNTSVSYTKATVVAQRAAGSTTAVSVDAVRRVGSSKTSGEVTVRYMPVTNKGSPPTTT